MLGLCSRQQDNLMLNMPFQWNFLCEPPKLGLIVPICVVATMMDMLWNDDGSFGRASHKTWRKILMRWQCLHIHDKALKLFFSWISHEALPAPASSVAVTWFQIKSYLFKAFSKYTLTRRKHTLDIFDTRNTCIFFSFLMDFRCLNV